MTRLKTNLVFVALATLFAASAQASVAAENCSAPLDPKLKGAALSEKLRRCNGVLKPSKGADPDIVLPAPAIDDPMTVKPKQLPGSEGLAK